jgi:hypothetical protein
MKLADWRIFPNIVQKYIWGYGFASPTFPLHWIGMDYVKGETLQDCWALLTIDQKNSVCKEIKGISDKIHGLRFESIAGFSLNSNGHPILAPFFENGAMYKNEQEFLLQSFCNNLCNLEKCKPELYSILSSVYNELEGVIKTWEQVPITFCHGDFAFRNLMYDAATGKVTLLDWEWCASKPIYCEWGEEMLEDEEEGQNEWIRNRLVDLGVYGMAPKFQKRVALLKLIDSFSNWRLDATNMHEYVIKCIQEYQSCDVS